MSEVENRYAFTLQEQLRADLSRKIEDGIYKPGDRLPSESELVEAYGVSRVTVRAALGMLVDEGVLVKRRGKGTFVRPTTIVEKRSPRAASRRPASRWASSPRRASS